MNLFKNVNPSLKTPDAVPAEFLQSAHRLNDGTLLTWLGLRIELVRIAHHLLLKFLWHKIFVGQGQLLLLNVPRCQTCTSMPLTDAGMPIPSFGTQHLTTYQPMTDIGFRAVTKDAWCMAAQNADIMKHGSLLQELRVQSQFRMFLHNQQAAIRYLPTVY